MITTRAPDGANNYQKAYTKHYIDVKMGQLHGGKSAKEFRFPPFRAKEKGFSYVRCSLMSETTVIYCEFISQIKTVSIIHKHPLSEKLPEESWSAEFHDLRFVFL